MSNTPNKDDRLLLSYLLCVAAILFGILISKISRAEENKPLVELESASIDTYKNTFRHDPYQPELTERWKYGGQFHLGIRFGDHMLWSNRLHLDGDHSKVQNAGWEFEVRYDRWQFQPFYYHHSEHSLDRVGSTKRFPQEDKVGLKLCLLGCFKKSN